MDGNGSLQRSPAEIGEEIRKSREHNKAKESKEQLAAEQKLIEKAKESGFKKQISLVIGFSLVILIVHTLGIYLFTSGFLLSRLVLEHNSTCSNPPAALFGSHVPGSVETGCWHPKKFDKAIILIIDALRYDFTIPDPTSSQYYHNAFPVLYDTAVSQPKNALLLPFIADPPTATMQRLKGLTTGTLPTFIDAGSNFAGTAIEEDNLLAQIVAAQKNIVHLGDDTWLALFPDHFNTSLSRAYDSFNVWDLHTVDNGVIEHILPLMDKSKASDWDLIIGHCLGLDHAGHRYGPGHPAAEAKLRQMNEFVEDVMEKIDDSTLLVLFGDHGMDSKGDHGGESDDEVEAALWMYSRKPVFGRRSNDALQPPLTAKERPVNQIDLVPTLSLLLGLPVPFNNLGAPIEEAFIGTNGNDFESLAAVNRLTSAQIRNYQEEYSRIRKPEQALVAAPNTMWDHAQNQWNHVISSTKKAGRDAFDVSATAYSDYQRSNLRMCKELWARFNLINMGLGISVLTIALGLVVAYIRASWTQSHFTSIHMTLLLHGSAGLVGGGLLGYAMAYLLPALGAGRTTSFTAALCCELILALDLFSSGRRYASLLPRSSWMLACIFVTLLLSSGFAANSFVIWEDETCLFFLAFFATLTLASAFRLNSPAERRNCVIHSFIFMVCIRTASLARLCREEQAAFCRSTYYSSATSSTSAPWQIMIPISIAIFLPAAIKAYFNQTQSWHGSAPLWVGVGFRGTLFLIAAYWILDAADDGKWFSFPFADLKTIRMYTAQLVLVIAAGAGSATFAYQGPFVAVQQIDFAADQGSPNDRPNSSKRGDGPARQSESTQSRPQFVIHGTTNLYGTHFAVFAVTILLIPLLLVQKPMGQASLALTSIAILSLLEVLALLRRTQASSRNPDIFQTIVGPTVLALLGHFAFFKTGHQAALSSFQWDVALIPLRKIQYPLSPFLMVLNTLGGQILCAAAVPACVLWRRPFRLSNSITGSSRQAAPGDANTEQKNNTLEEQQRQQREVRENERLTILRLVTKAVATHILVYATINLATTLWAAHLRRHLMLYRVFCPRWMLSVFALVVVELVAAVLGVAAVRYSVGSAHDLFGW